ncbi:MAG: hypothetical protein M3Q81_03995 [bacterium]|nr:hypothetical protein [bacterium]
MKIRNFDVLVVYTEDTAKSASDLSYTESSPFPADADCALYSKSYAYFIESCHEVGLTCAFTTSADVIGAGACKSYWLYSNEKWHKVKQECYSREIFDKFSPTNPTMAESWHLLFSAKTIRSFNNAFLFKLFFDKLETYNQLSAYSIPTVELSDTSRVDISLALKDLNELVLKHPSSEDFSSAIILKDRYGAGGNHIYKITSNWSKEITLLTRAHPTVNFVLQPLVMFEHGFTYNNHTTATDIRLIYQNGKLLQKYIRMAKSDDFRCNQHQGGTLKYVKTSDIPTAVLQLSQEICDELDQKNSLFALDFIISNTGHIYLLEGNISPGITWDVTSDQDEIMCKKLIKGIVAEMAKRVLQQPVLTPSPLLTTTIINQVFTGQVLRNSIS